ncbi:MAG: DNA gyrase inhibitor YacG [Sphingomonadaceae bacterium]
MSRPSRPDARPCPVCGRPATNAHAPFCSAVCRDRDLIAWLDERYVVPGPPAGEGDGDG